MTTPAGPYRVEYLTASLPGVVVGPPVPTPGGFLFLPQDRSSLSAEGWRDVLNSVYRSGRAPLLELLRECRPYLAKHVQARDLLDRIRAALKETNQ